MTEQFYDRLASFSEFATFADFAHYVPLPTDWYVVITDVRGSTQAILNGQYKQVNAMGAASIMALLNATNPIPVPYVFGGDGATVCVPPSRKTAVKSALAATRKMAHDDFKLDLRIGMVSMAEIAAAGYQVMVGKYQPSPHYQQAMFLGDGLAYAEDLIKDKAADNPYLLADDIAPDGSFEGFECRWNEIPSPYEETVAILVKVINADSTAEREIYTAVSQGILDIYGQEPETHHPIRDENLSLSLSLQTLGGETVIRTAFQPKWKRILYQFKLWGLVLLGKYLMARGVQTETTDWGAYRQMLIANSDYRKFDEVLRMVLSGTAVQRQQLRDLLEKWRQDGTIIYGIHASKGALMTCLISDYAANHVHFLDGSSGGYALAAKEMKAQVQH